MPMRRDQRLPDWPAAMRRSTAARYLDLSEAEFSREVASGALPAPFRLGRSDRWRKVTIDRALGLDFLEPIEDDWRSRVKAYSTGSAGGEKAEDAPPRSVLTPNMLAVRWGMSVGQIYSMNCARRIGGFKLGARLIRFRLDEVEAAEAERQGD